jgi:hypothetical protein
MRDGVTMVKAILEDYKKSVEDFTHLEQGFKMGVEWALELIEEFIEEEEG